MDVFGNPYLVISSVRRLKMRRLTSGKGGNPSLVNPGFKSLPHEGVGTPLKVWVRRESGWCRVLEAGDYLAIIPPSSFTPPKIRLKSAVCQFEVSRDEALIKCFLWTPYNELLTGQHQTTQRSGDHTALFSRYLLNEFSRTKNLEPSISILGFGYDHRYRGPTCQYPKSFPSRCFKKTTGFWPRPPSTDLSRVRNMG